MSWAMKTVRLWRKLNCWTGSLINKNFQSHCSLGMGNTLPAPVVVCLASTTSYVATSVYFLMNPLAKHKAIPKMRQIPLIAHRGGAGEGYENTILAFKRAVEVGAGMLELDVHLSRDGIYKIFNVLLYENSYRHSIQC